MEARQQRLTTILVLVLLLAALSTEAHEATPGLHPVVLLPGYSCSQLEARLTDEYKPPTPGCGVPKQGRRWFRLWDNYTALQEDPALLPCYEDQLRLVYDRAAGDYRNLPGVETRRVLSFGTTRSFFFDDPAKK
jgi:lysophospholipase-3